jgi:hypothetical protein
LFQREVPAGAAPWRKDINGARAWAIRSNHDTPQALAVGGKLFAFAGLIGGSQQPFAVPSAVFRSRDQCGTG